MKVILDINDKHAVFVTELLNCFSYVKVKPLTKEKARLSEEIKEAVDNLNLVKKGKMKTKLLKDLLNEL